MEEIMPDATGVISILIVVCAFMLPFVDLPEGAVKTGITP